MPSANIRHAGLYNFKSIVSDEAKLDFFNALLELKNIPGVQKLELSKQISPKNNFQHGFSMEFESQELLDAYAKHPLHDVFLEQFWFIYVQDFMEIDTISVA